VPLSGAGFLQCLCGEKKTVTSSTSIEESKQEEAAFKQAASAIEVLFGFF
jgi:hypothetical protein